MNPAINVAAKVRNEKGITLVYVAILIVVFLSFTALAVDMGYVMVARNQLQDIADGAALAGARTLGRMYECNGNIAACTEAMPYPTQLIYEPNQEVIKNAIQTVASINQAGEKMGITINDPDDIVIGNWNATNKTIIAATVSPDAVRVTARRDNLANNPITTYFASIMGINTVNVSAVATAALTGQSTEGPGGIPLPIAIDLTWLSSPKCNDDLTFHPSSGTQCAAWHTYDGKTYQPSAAGLKKELKDITDGKYISPETYVGQTEYDFSNQTGAELFTGDYVKNLFNTMKVKNDGLMDRDDNPETWTTSLAVYDDSEKGCKPSGMIPIVGFVSVVVTGFSGPPDNTLFTTVVCDLVGAGRGSGGNFGTKGSIPGLVQ